MNELIPWKEFGVTESEDDFTENYEKYLQMNDWYKTQKYQVVKTALENGMRPSNSVTIKGDYMDIRVIYPKQEQTFDIDTDMMKKTTITVEEIDGETGEIVERNVNAYEYFCHKPVSPRSPYMAVYKHE